MKMIRSAFLILSLITFCCFRTTDYSKDFVFQNSEDVKQGPCAVFVAPTAVQLDSIKAHMKESDFFTMTDDNMFYMSNARTFLESKNVPMSNVEASGTMKFRKSDGKIYEMKLSDLKWAIILFNGKSDPILANMVGVENDYTRYMK
ncbi:MAG TPA: hypothetical protein VFJ43_09775 [Bacteroidia bacterium]|nr:hypothetical protein [Bacteroidia bacterium]